jgi:hypothetical protein
MNIHGKRRGNPEKGNLETWMIPIIRTPCMSLSMNFLGFLTLLFSSTD